MSPAFALVYLGVLAFQGLTIKPILKKPGPLWGFFCFKLMALPLWAALTFAGPLFILPGLLVLGATVVAIIIAMVITIFSITKGDPGLMTDFTSKKEYEEPRVRVENYLIFFGALVLITLSIAGTIGLM